MKPTHRVCEVVGDIKSASSRWVHTSIGSPAFRWQEGYGAFTTSVVEDSQLRNYIRNQREHHQVKTFKMEYKEFLDEAGIQWDPKYLQ